MPRVIVVAGDNELLQAVPAELEPSVEVTNIESSNEAMWELQMRGAPDVLIADVDLPGFSGLDLADLIPDFAPTTRVLLHARTPSSELDEQAAQRDLFRLLKGPITMNQLLQTIQEAFAAGPVERAEEPPPAYVPEPEPEPVAPAAPRRAGPPPVSAPPRAATPRDVDPSRSGGAPFSSVSKAPPPAPVRKAPPQVSARPESPGRTSLASRAKAATPTERTPPPPQRTPPAQPVPPPVQQAAPPAPEEQKRRPTKAGGALVLTAESLAPIRARLQDLGLQLGAQATVLTDRWGVPLVEEGRTSLPLPPFLPLLATSFSTMIEYTSQLHTDEGSGLYMHEGNRYDLYIFDVGSQFLLVMVFDKDIASSKLGSVWLYAKRAVRDLADELEGS